MNNYLLKQLIAENIRRKIPAFYSMILVMNTCTCTVYKQWIHIPLSRPDLSLAKEEKLTVNNAVFEKRERDTNEENLERICKEIKKVKNEICE